MEEKDIEKLVADEVKKIEERLEDIRKNAGRFFEKAEKGEFSSSDIKELSSMQRQAEEIRKMASKVPLLGDICMIAADLSVLLKKALVLMFENMQIKSTAPEEKVYINKQGIEQSNRMEQVMEKTIKANSSAVLITGKSNSPNKKREKLIARSNYFGYESTEEENEKEKDPILEKKRMALEKAKLDAYNKDVKKRAGANNKNDASKEADKSSGESKKENSASMSKE